MPLGLISPDHPTMTIPDFNHMKLMRELETAKMEVISYSFKTIWVDTPDKIRLDHGNKLEDDYLFHYRQVMFIHIQRHADILLNLMRVGGLLPQYGLEFCQFMLMSGMNSLFILANREDESLIQSLVGSYRHKPEVYTGYTDYQRRMYQPEKKHEA